MGPIGPAGPVGPVGPVAPGVPPLVRHPVPDPEKSCVRFVLTLFRFTTDGVKVQPERLAESENDTGRSAVMDIE
jgi:hypothetical protein